MEPIQQLRNEHKVILRVAKRMEDAVQGPVDKPVPYAFLTAACEFMRTYADRNHHGKEEGALFDIMRRNPRLGGMAAILQEEHVDGRSMIDAVAQALDERDDTQARRAVQEWVWHIRAHIAKEDEMIFEAVERELDRADAEELARAFELVEAHALGPGGVEQLLERLESAKLNAVIK
jgi:hemerythrin-like domain-containing protein